MAGGLYQHFQILYTLIHYQILKRPDYHGKSKGFLRILILQIRVPPVQINTHENLLQKLYCRRQQVHIIIPPEFPVFWNVWFITPAPAVTVFFILVTARCVYILRNFAISASVLFPYTGIFASSVSGFSYSSCVSVTEAAPKFSSMRSVFRIPGIGTMKYHAVNPKAAGYAPHFPD